MLIQSFIASKKLKWPVSETLKNVKYLRFSLNLSIFVEFSMLTSIINWDNFSMLKLIFKIIFTFGENQKITIASFLRIQKFKERCKEDTKTHCTWANQHILLSIDNRLSNHYSYIKILRLRIKHIKYFLKFFDFFLLINIAQLH